MLTIELSYLAGNLTQNTDLLSDKMEHEGPISFREHFSQFVMNNSALNRNAQDKISDPIRIMGGDRTNCKLLQGMLLTFTRIPLLCASTQYHLLHI